MTRHGAWSSVTRATGRVGLSAARFLTQGGSQMSNLPDPGPTHAPRSPAGVFVQPRRLRRPFGPTSGGSTHPRRELQAHVGHRSANRRHLHLSAAAALGAFALKTSPARSPAGVASIVIRSIMPSKVPGTAGARFTTARSGIRRTRPVKSRKPETESKTALRIRPLYAGRYCFLRKRRSPRATLSVP